MGEKLERLICLLTDTSDMTDDEVRAELEGRGIDLAASQERFDRFLDQAFADLPGRRHQLTICTDGDSD